jgi:hypothetical protein
MKLELREVKDGKDKNRYCGPAVISALTDLTTGEAARLIRKQSGRKAIRGTDKWEVFDALKTCGIWGRDINVKPEPWSNKPTLARWLKESKDIRTPGRVFLLVAGNHWQLVSGRRYTCGRIREIVSIKDKRVKRRARVTHVWELMSDNVTRPRDANRNDIDVSKPKSKSNPYYYRVKKMIQQYPEFDLTYEKDDIDYWVTMSSELEKYAEDTKHPLCDEHYCFDIEEVAQRMEKMVAFAKEHYPKLKEKEKQSAVDDLRELVAELTDH